MPAVAELSFTPGEKIQAITPEHSLTLTVIETTPRPEGSLVLARVSAPLRHRASLASFGIDHNGDPIDPHLVIKPAEAR